LISSINSQVKGSSYEKVKDRCEPVLNIHTPLSLLLPHFSFSFFSFLQSEDSAF